MNQNLKTELIDKLTEIDLNEAIVAIKAAVPGNSMFSSLKARSNKLELDQHSGLITHETYNVELANLRRALSYEIERLNEDNLKKAFIYIVNNGDQSSGANTSFLFIAASPKDQDNLQIEYEYAAIKNVLASSVNRDKFIFQNPVLAATIESMLDGINALKPIIIHFSGHAGKKGIVLSDDNNNAELIPNAILESYFDTFNKPIDCVFLNACYSAGQAAVISKHVKYVVGMNCPIGDDAAIIFSKAFYSSLFNDNDLNYEKAFKQARIKLQFKVTEESSTPEIWKNEELMVI